MGVHHLNLRGTPMQTIEQCKLLPFRRFGHTLLKNRTPTLDTEPTSRMMVVGVMAALGDRQLEYQQRNARISRLERQLHEAVTEKRFLERDLDYTQDIDARHDLETRIMSTQERILQWRELAALGDR
jgi:C4-dicarboxylate-specific signal transduction histidine kinase